MANEVLTAQYLVEFLLGINKGALVTEVGQNLSLLVETVKTRHKSGKMTITIEVLPAGANRDDDNDVMHLRATTKLALPPLVRGASTFFAHSDGTLRRDRENQLSMFEEARPRIVAPPQPVSSVRMPGEADFEDDRPAVGER